ncbi:MAG: hypothetical protein NTW19_17510 [Planctomycetota bacterium]|nr:hypothetical protein [Planctomycetota bacterium]
MAQRGHDDWQPGLPSEQDFFESNVCDLDALWAWKNFGCLTLDQADEKYRDHPEAYIEDFYHMGGRAFAYYFPVIERDLLEAPDEDGAYHGAYFLACAIKNQFGAERFRHVLHLAPRVLAVSHFVRKNIRRYGYGDDDIRQIDEAWRELEERVQTVVKSQGGGAGGDTPITPV